jgi:PAS domain S-box-containing protein
MNNRNRRKSLFTRPAKIALAYFLVGGMWITFVHRGLSLIFSEQRVHAILDFTEGWIFITVSALLIYLLIDRAMRETRRSEDALIESQRTLATLLSNLPGLAYRCRNDRNWTMEFVSDGCHALTGYLPEELLYNKTVSYSDLIHPDDREKVWQDVQEAVKQNRPFQLTYRIITATGEEKWVWEQGRIVPSERGQIPVLEGFISDITEHRKAMDELRKHQNHLADLVKERTQELETAQKTLVQREKLKTLGIIAAEVAHEIRNPLVAIGGFARRLQRKYPHLSESDIILKETIRLERMLDRITNYLKPVVMSPIGCSINTILSECRDLLAPELAGRNITLRLDLEPELAPVYSDPDILMQVFINIIQYEMFRIKAGDSIIAKTWSDEQNLYAAFKSPLAGEKIKEPELLFLPFDDGGESIGLPFAYRLVKDMGGLMGFSQEENYCLFTVSLPKHVSA